MAALTDEVLTKIVETHTMMAVVVKDIDNHKKVTNARLSEVNDSFNKHKDDVDKKFKDQQLEINDGKAFRVRVATYASIAAGLAAFFSEPVIGGVKRLFGA